MNFKMPQNLKNRFAVMSSNMILDKIHWYKQKLKPEQSSIVVLSSSRELSNSNQYDRESNFP